MCGGCGSRATTDWASPAVATPGARQQVATTVSGLCRGAGLRVDVRTDVAGWVVRSPTGRSVVASSLTELWAAVASVGGLPPAFPPPPGRAGGAGGAGRGGAAPDAAAAPPAPARRVVAVLGAPGPRLLDWATQVVVAHCGDAADAVDDLDEALQGGRGQRVVVACASTASVRHVLAAAGSPRLGRRCTVTAAVRSGAGPGWLDDVDALADRPCRDLLDGAVLDGAVLDGAVLDGVVPAGEAGAVAVVLERPHLGDQPAMATWLGGQVVCGATRGRRVRVVLGCGRGRVVLDAADGVGLAVRAAP